MSTKPLQSSLKVDDKPLRDPAQVTSIAEQDNLLHGDVPGWLFADDKLDVGARWNKSYPYQLLMVKAHGGDNYSIESSFTLPIPPQAMTISTPFAISTTVTLGGIIEEHNGAPLRTISFQGTTGVRPTKGTGEILKGAAPGQGIFAGTIRTANGASSALGTAQAGVLGQPRPAPNLVGEAEAEKSRGTGYYQFRLLQKFLESYAHRKRVGGAENASLRLAVAIWKDAAVYLVTPISFEVARSAASPWEYPYNLNFKAWRRIKLSGDPGKNEIHGGDLRNPSTLAKILNGIQMSRRMLAAGQSTLLAIRGDIQKVLFEPLRETALFCKDLLGVTATAADLPDSIVKDMKSAFFSSKDAIKRLGQDLRSAGHRTDKTWQDFVSLFVKSGKSETGSGQAVSPGQSKGALSGPDPAVPAFDHPGDYPEIFEHITPSTLPLPPAVQRKILEEQRRVRRLQRLDFERMRDQLVTLLVELADAVGAGSADYDEAFGRRSTAREKVTTDADFDMLFGLNQAIMELNRLAATSTATASATTMELMAGMASASGIAFRVPASKFAVPFPYGSSIEQLAAQYLGDANRWHEIVALNGLRQPYVDEEGFDLPLATNGYHNQVLVQDTGNIYVGQPVWLSSTNSTRTKRHVVAIEHRPGQALLTLDGDPDLDRYQTMAQATVTAFLPDTVNSQMMVYIPSETVTDDEFMTKDIPGVDQFDPLIHAGGVDLLLTQDGDLAVTPDGDCRLAMGVSNLIQRIRVAMETPRGALIHHPEYGFGLNVGVSTADVDVKEVASSLSNMFKSDASFSGVSSVAIAKKGPVLQVSMTVGIAGTQQTLPVTVNIKR
jgi:hypothetical protein